MTRIRDVFAGWKVTLERNPVRFLVSVLDEHGRTIVATVTDNLPDAMSLAEEWMLILSDDRRYVGDVASARRAVKRLLQEAVATMNMEDHQEVEKEKADVGAWFRRQWESL